MGAYYDSIARTGSSPGKQVAELEHLSRAEAAPRLRRSWSRLRYGRLLARAARSRASGRRYARLVSAVELMIDRSRHRTAVARIARWQNVSRTRAAGIFLSSLASEAQEEADTAFFMHDIDALLRWLPRPAELPSFDGPAVFATLHLGSPVLALVCLRRSYGLDARPIIRALDATNPMADPKRRFGERKVAWLSELEGVDFFGTDRLSIAVAREHLLRGRPLFAAVDVPGEVVARARPVAMCGERLLFSAGVLDLARMTRSAILPVVAISHPDRMSMHFGRAVPPEPGRDATEALFGEMERLIHRFPGEWWLWPYVSPYGSAVDGTVDPCDAPPGGADR